MCLILGSIYFGYRLFISAGTIALNEQYAIFIEPINKKLDSLKLTGDLQKKRLSIDKALKEDQDSLDVLWRRNIDAAQSLEDYITDTSKLRMVIDSILNNYLFQQSYSYLYSDYKIDSSRIELLISKANDIENLLNSGSAEVLKSANKSNQVLASTLVTRVGSVFLIIFLVQLLVQLYKYIIRLAGYYSARADALELLVGEIANELRLEKLVAILSPDGLDFGRPTKTPAGYAVDLAKEIIARNGK